MVCIEYIKLVEQDIAFTWLNTAPKIEAIFDYS